jgi:hypothetical protein
MADYRGGDRHRTQYGDALVKAIQEGRTRGQQNRNLGQKMVMAGAQAALQGGRAVYGKVTHDQKVEEDRRKAMEDYIKTPAPNYKPMASEATDAKLPGWLTGGQGDRTELGIDNDVLASVKSDAPRNPYDSLPAAPEPEEEDNTKYATWGTGRKGRGMMGSQ